jgi:hypothetical protein
VLGWVTSDTACCAAKNKQLSSCLVRERLEVDASACIILYTMYSMYNRRYYIPACKGLLQLSMPVVCPNCFMLGGERHSWHCLPKMMLLCVRLLTPRRTATQHR